MVTTRNFLVFLLEYKCLDAYWANFEKSNFADGYRSASLAMSLVFDYSPRVWLLRSFDWDRSAEGFNYWSRLNDLWDMRCNYLIRNEI